MKDCAQPLNENSRKPPHPAHLLQMQAELRERLSAGCALPAAERAHIKAMLVMVQKQMEQQGEPAKPA